MVGMVGMRASFGFLWGFFSVSLFTVSLSLGFLSGWSGWSGVISPQGPDPTHVDSDPVVVVDAAIPKHPFGPAVSYL